MKIEGGGIIKFGEHSIEFSFRRSSRAKRTILTVYPDGRLVATIPQRASEHSARRLILRERVWVLKSLEKIRNKKSITFPCVQKKELTNYKKKSKAFIEKPEFSPFIPKTKDTTLMTVSSVIFVICVL
ncbi:MAG: DUF45 domain-containing protein [Bacteroidetes bacterium]|nr:DUF45 domain-containing protein [Bacteroidota bacterium]